MAFRCGADEDKRFLSGYVWGIWEAEVRTGELF